jgi:hypothetical protein
VYLPAFLPDIRECTGILSCRPAPDLQGELDGEMGSCVSRVFEEQAAALEEALLSK